MKRVSLISVFTCLVLLLSVISIISLSFFPANVNADVPLVSEIRVADVTTRSFSVVWITSESSTASLLVYAPDCSTTVGGINVVGESNEGTGVIKATVTGLAPATTYCFKTVTTSNTTPDTTYAPVTGQLVTTESQTIRTYDDGVSIRPFGNDLIYHPVYDRNQNLDSGSVLMISVDGSSYPVSTWSNHMTNIGVMPGAIVDLNNVFDEVYHADIGTTIRENMNLVGGERMSLLEIRGTSGCTLERWRKVPEEIPVDMELVEVNTPGLCFIKADIDCNDLVDIGDLILDINGLDTYVGHTCYNSDLDQDGDGLVDVFDLILTINDLDRFKE